MSYSKAEQLQAMEFLAIATNRGAIVFSPKKLMKRVKKYRIIFKDTEPVYGGWFELKKIQAKDIETARKQCAKELGAAKFEPSWMDVREVKK